MVECPICGKQVIPNKINAHIDANCQTDLLEDQRLPPSTTPAKAGVSNFFALRSTQPVIKNEHANLPRTQPTEEPKPASDHITQTKRAHDSLERSQDVQPSPKRARVTAAFEKAQPLAERMRPHTLDDVYGQELVGPDGVLRGLIMSDRVPSMILWGGPGTGKTTIARLIAQSAGTRFVEINSTSSGVAECKKLFADARNELSLTGRKTIIFCDEIHRFSKSQQDVFLGPVEAGTVTLIGATTENPSFKVVNALLSRCRVFTLAKLTPEHIVRIMERALRAVAGEPERDASRLGQTDKPLGTGAAADDVEVGEVGEEDRSTQSTSPDSPTSRGAGGRQTLLNNGMLLYLANFADGDARTALNLLELAMDLSKRPNMTEESLKRSLTHTLVYDRAGDQHYDTISAFHKSVRGSDADAALYYLARMLQSGEDALYIARRMVVIASEDVGLADNSMLSLATATYTAAEKIGMPEARINLAHCAVALCLSRKSTRAYRGLGRAMAALQEPGVAGLPIPLHIRNAPTKLMQEMGYGKAYKYNPDYVDGAVSQDYLPQQLAGRRFLEERDLGTEIDPDLQPSGGSSAWTRAGRAESETAACAAESGTAEAGAGEAMQGGSFVVGDGHLEMSVE